MLLKCVLSVGVKFPPIFLGMCSVTSKKKAHFRQLATFAKDLLVLIHHDSTLYRSSTTGHARKNRHGNASNVESCIVLCAFSEVSGGLFHSVMARD